MNDFLLRLRPKNGVHAIHALRRRLKFLLRSCGLRAVSVEEIPSNRGCAPVRFRRHLKLTRYQTMSKTIRLACWDCFAVYASPQDEPCCPNCGWRPTSLVQTADGSWADPTSVILGTTWRAGDGPVVGESR
jgi:hypothetical protein